MIRSRPPNQPLPLHPPRRSQHRKTLPLRDRRRRQPHARRPPPHKQRLPPPNAQVPIQRPPTRLQHLRQRAQDLPLHIRHAHLARKLRLHERILRIPAVDFPPQSAHARGHDVAVGEFGAGARGDEADAFDAEDAREADVGGLAEAGEEFGAVEAEGFDVYKDLAFRWDGDGTLFDLEGRGGAGVVQDDGSHCGGHRAGLVEDGEY